MRWPFKKGSTDGPSQEAVDFGEQTDRELEEVRKLKSQAKDVGDSLRRRREENHFGLGLEAIVRGGPA